MADNINLTVADINNLKNNQNTAITRLDIKNFIFDSATDKAGNEQIPIVPGSLSDGRGMRVYAGKSQQLNMKNKKKHKVDFDLSGTGWTTQVDPIVVATVDGDASLSVARLFLWTEITSTKITVHIDATKKITGNTPFKVNIVAIGYA